MLDGIYALAAGIAGAFGRGLKRGLPASFRARLEAIAPQGIAPGWIWLHAVSVGELLLAAGLLAKLREEGHRVHVTTGTTAGMELLLSRLPAWDAGSRRISGGMFPFDDWAGLSDFLRTPPGAFIALETEIWPNLFRELDVRAVPICIVNGRLTGKTASSPFAPFLRRASSRLSLVAARDQESHALFVSMGAPNVAIGGNLKADLPPPQELHSGWGKLLTAWDGEQVMVAGNTVEGEEEAVFDAWGYAKETYPGLKLIVAPRQPKRFGDVAAWLSSRHPLRRATIDLADGSRDGGIELWRDADLLLLDTMGELASVYRLGGVAVVGGGWRAGGGHNPLEPLRWGVPTLIGPRYSNFEDVVAPLLESGFLRTVSEGDLPRAVVAALGQRGHGPAQLDRFELPPQLRNTLQITWECLAPHLPAPAIGNTRPEGRVFPSVPQRPSS